MSTLVLVRHGQASFGARNYDQLSALGERQSVLLGEHWQRCGLGFEAAFSGTMQRQRVTAERALAASESVPAGLRIERAFNEFDHEGLIRAYLPVIAREQPDLRLEPQHLFSDPPAFQRFFTAVIASWMSDRPAEGPVAEPWAVFRARCLQGFATAAAAGERVVAFTSGGVIMAALQQALGLEDAVALRLNWRIFNASVHVFSVGPGGLALLGFNDVAHLQQGRDAQLLTRR